MVGLGGGNVGEGEGGAAHTSTRTGRRRPAATSLSMILSYEAPFLTGDRPHSLGHQRKVIPHSHSVPLDLGLYVFPQATHSMSPLPGFSFSCTFRCSVCWRCRSLTLVSMLLTFLCISCKVNAAPMKATIPRNAVAAPTRRPIKG